MTIRVEGLTKTFPAGRGRPRVVAVRDVGFELARGGALGIPHQLSAGQRQRLAIAKAIAVDPAVLVLDEATVDGAGHSGMAVLPAVERFFGALLADTTLER